MYIYIYIYTHTFSYMICSLIAHGGGRTHPCFDRRRKSDKEVNDAQGDVKTWLEYKHGFSRIPSKHPQIANSK